MPTDPIHFTSTPADTTFVLDQPQYGNLSLDGINFGTVDATYDDTSDPLSTVTWTYTVTLTDGSHYDTAAAPLGISLDLGGVAGDFTYVWEALNSAMTGVAKVTAHVLIQDAGSNSDTQDVNLIVQPAPGAGAS